MSLPKFVQPIAVSRTGSHEDVVHAVASASVWRYMMRDKTDIESEGIWQLWLAGPFTKTVRRGTNAQFAAALESIDSSGCRFGEAEACAAPPVLDSDLAAPWSKMQVSGLDRERGGWPPHVLGPTFCITPHVEMTTGKTAAQVAHALFDWFLRLDEHQAEAWASIGYQFNVTDDAAAWRWAISNKPAVVIVDSGYTEIEPDTVTVVSL